MMIDFVVVLRTFLKPIEEIQRDQQQDNCRHRGGIFTGPDRQADNRHGPERRRRRQTANGRPVANNRAGPKETDARDHLGSQARRIAVGDQVTEAGCQQDRQHHSQGRADAEDGVGPQAGRLVMTFALIADQPTQDRCRHQPEDHFPHGECSH